LAHKIMKEAVRPTFKLGEVARVKEGNRNG